MSELSPTDLLKAFEQKLRECVESKKVLREGWVKLVEAISVYFDRELKGPPTIADAIGPVLESMQASLDQGKDAYDPQVLREALAKWDGVEPMEGILENPPQTRNRPPGLRPTSERKPGDKPTAPLPKQPPASDPPVQEEKSARKPTEMVKPSGSGFNKSEGVSKATSQKQTAGSSAFGEKAPIPKTTTGSSALGEKAPIPNTTNTARVAPVTKRKTRKPSPVARMTAYSAVKAAAKAKAAAAVDGDDTDAEEREARARIKVKKEYVEAKLPPAAEHSDEPEATSRGRKKTRFFKSKAYIDSDDDDSQAEAGGRQEREERVGKAMVRRARTMVVEITRRASRTSEEMDVEEEAAAVAEVRAKRAQKGKGKMVVSESEWEGKESSEESEDEGDGETAPVKMEEIDDDREGDSDVEEANNSGDGRPDRPGLPSQKRRHGHDAWSKLSSKKCDSCNDINWDCYKYTETKRTSCRRCFRLKMGCSKTKKAPHANEAKAGAKRKRRSSKVAASISTPPPPTPGAATVKPPRKRQKTNAGTAVDKNTRPLSRASQRPALTVPPTPPSVPSHVGPSNDGVQEEMRKLRKEMAGLRQDLQKSLVTTHVKMKTLEAYVEQKVGGFGNMALAAVTSAVESVVDAIFAERLPGYRVPEEVRPMTWPAHHFESFADAFFDEGARREMERSEAAREESEAAESEAAESAEENGQAGQHGQETKSEPEGRTEPEGHGAQRVEQQVGTSGDAEIGGAVSEGGQNTVDAHITESMVAEVTPQVPLLGPEVLQSVGQSAEEHPEVETTAVAGSEIPAAEVPADIALDNQDLPAVQAMDVDPVLPSLTILPTISEAPERAPTPMNIDAAAHQSINAAPASPDVKIGPLNASRRSNRGVHTASSRMSTPLSSAPATPMATRSPSPGIPIATPSPPPLSPSPPPKISHVGQRTRSQSRGAGTSNGGSSKPSKGASGGGGGSSSRKTRRK